MFDQVFSYRCLLSRTRFCNVAYLRNVRALKVFSHTKLLHVYGDCFLKRSPYSNVDSAYTHIGPYHRSSYLVKRLFSSSTYINDQFKSTASEKLKMLKQKKEARRMERMARQRINELRRNVCTI